MKKTNVIGIILAICIVAFLLILVITIINYDPVKKEKQEINNTLSTDQMINLLKYANYHLRDFDVEQSTQLDEKYMVLFALDYIQVAKQNVKIEYTSEYRIVLKTAIDEAVKHIFDKSIDYSKLEFELKDDKVYVTNYPIGTDAQIYKFKTREYDEKAGIYTVYIDCLEASGSDFSEIIEGSVTEYEEKYVFSTMVFKYIEKENRRVLLAYSLEYKK